MAHLILLSSQEIDLFSSEETCHPVPMLLFTMNNDGGTMGPRGHLPCN